MKEKVYRDRSHNHDTISIIPKSSYFLSSSFGGRSKILQTTSYFAHPYHSWERGLNENTNGLIRQYFPKRTDFSKITDAQIHEVQEKINNRLRKCLGWHTPNEVFLNPTAIVALPC